MLYNPNAFFLRARDVTAAWLMCLGVAVCAALSEMAE
jgi:hypothetical protein